MWFLLASAFGGDRPARLPRGEAKTARIVSPSRGSVQTTAWIPLAVQLPAGFQDARIELRLDGAPLEPPHAALTAGRTADGRAVRYLATLDLLDLAPGEHALALRATSEAGTRTLGVTFEVAPRPARVELTVADEDGPTWARVAVFDGDGPVSLVGPDVDALDPLDRDDRLHSVFVGPGGSTVLLEPGRYRLVATRGVRDTVHEREVEVGVGQSTVGFELERAVPTPGWHTADLHVHTGHSGDAFTPDVPRMHSLAASGLELAVTSEHNHIHDAAPLARAVLGDHPVEVVAGIEARLGPRGDSAGHVNAFPLDPDTPPHAETSHELARLVADWHARQHVDPHDAGLVLQLNHPRGIQMQPDELPYPKAHAVFTERGFDPDQPLDTEPNAWLLAEHSGLRAADLDAMEVLNRFSWPLYLQVRRDWFALLDGGLPVTGTGNSDSHGLAVEQLGVPVNLVQADPGDLAAVVEALQAGKVSVSTGPIVELEVSGTGPGGTVTGGVHEVVARVRAAPWVPVRELRLVVDGEVVELTDLDDTGVQRGELVVQVALDGDGWILAEAGWPLTDDRPTSPEVGGLYGDVAPGYVPIGFTNPVLVDADDDGAWEPAGAAAP